MFYKLQIEDGKKLLFSALRVHSPKVTLLAENKDTYSYPADGWYWINTREEALKLWSLTEEELKPPKGKDEV